MFHPPQDEFFYLSYLVTATFSDDLGKKIEKLATAFVLSVGDDPWIITNRHVIDLNYRQSSPKYRDFSLESISLTGRKPDDSIYQIELLKNSRVIFDEEYQNDVAMILPRSDSANAEKLHWHFGINHLANDDDFNNIKPFDLVYYTGFPPQHDKLASRQIGRSGRIASDPRFNYSWDNIDRGDCVAYEGFSFGGSSGSPIFTPHKGLHGITDARNAFLIGLNAGHIPTPEGHSGISYFYKSTVIRRMIQKNNLL
tara:strand:- start:620 stop:1381 length:762 start_codon:yes stop_codon:yes gene_type:complete